MEAIISTKDGETSLLRRSWMGWAPLVILFSLALPLRGRMAPWGFMWMMAIALFAGFKWWTWSCVNNVKTPGTERSLYYLFLWPGMDARHFLDRSSRISKPARSAWLWACAKTILGAILVWGVARVAGHGLLAGWIGMIGFIFLLHFGLFELLALFWQSLGIQASPLMRCPIAARSLGDFWGRRWNAGFRDIVFGLFFIRFAKRFGAAAAAILTFLLSGMIHELVITLPSGAGYGLPSLYFALQGTGMLFERSRMGFAMGLTQGWRAHVFTIAVVTLPIGALFPPPFVLRVMIPFFQVIKALS